MLRHVRASDAAATGAFVASLSPASRRLSFHGAINALPASLLRAMTNPDPAREVAFVAVDTASDVPTVVADARYVLGPAPDEAEFAIAVADDWQGLGLGGRLMRLLAHHATVSGLRQLHGEVLTGNQRMIELAQRLGSRVSSHPLDASVLRIRWSLTAPPPASSTCSTLGGHDTVVPTEAARP